ncbi:NAD-dependent epimerase/dehydratase family protein [Melioribacteraceae bacterium 4301-Me]|uniref:NAD-dependent epimerase/dehydratase family protein n=1 Tax=Pyranulibacter aquaticus TaxID=3163344 RepID=UPI0035978F1F
MQTILGSGGAIGTELAKALKRFTNKIRLVSRNPKKVNETDFLLAADLTDAQQLSKAVEGSTVCYVTIGFEYKTKIWQQVWLTFIKNVVSACKDNKAKLVFFDNIYAIDCNHINHITEESPINPASKKGEIRALVDRYIIENVEKGNIEAIIARSPDFFGPIKKSSIIMNLIYNNLQKGKPALWFCNADVIYTPGYTYDLAMGAALLGNTNDAFNQVWNLPVDQSHATAREFTQMFAEIMNVKNRLKVLPAWSIKLLGFFVPVLKEIYEMRYQYDRDYFFDSSKFIRRFNYVPVSNKKAIEQTIELMKYSKLECRPDLP